MNTNIDINTKLSNIEKELSEIKDYVNKLNDNIEKLTEKIDNNITTECTKMGNHIDFIEQVYYNVKNPLEYICKQVNNLIDTESINDKLINDEFINEKNIINGLDLINYPPFLVS